jgi:uncharacterized transporter YbjL
MIDVVRALLESSPLLALFLAIAAGYAIGQIPIGGVSFGAGAVLLTGLVVGAVAPKSSPPAMVGTLGLVMLVYGVGVQYGAQFFASFAWPGLKYMVLSAVAVVASLGVAIAVAAPLAFRWRPRPGCSLAPVPARRRCKRRSRLRATRIRRSGIRSRIPSAWSARSS